MNGRNKSGHDEGAARSGGHAHRHPLSQPPQGAVDGRGPCAVVRVQHAPDLALGDAEVVGVFATVP